MQDNINSIVPTKDGSNTLFSKLYNQHYHNPDDGAINEALSKHIIPAFTFHKNKNELTILDICFGIGYNTFSTIYYCFQNNLNIKLNIFSPELDGNLVKSLENFAFPKEFDCIKHIINSIAQNCKYEDENVKIEVFIGDARDYIKSLEKNSFDKNEVLNDYKLANLSRQISLMGRKEVLTGKAKFGIFGDGKEIAQIALAKNFQNGDWNSVLFTFLGIIFIIRGVENLYFKKYYIEWDDNELRLLLPDNKILETIILADINYINIKLFKIELKVKDQTRSIKLSNLRYKDQSKFKEKLENINKTKNK